MNECVCCNLNVIELNNLLFGDRLCCDWLTQLDDL